ncbi:MAG: holo-ACP synthase [Solirubrobacterales bacterium]|nr:holo-ACP synthase [Solirubrobacterales bacterium]
MSLSVGIDLLEIARLEQAIARRPRLEQRLFTELERAEAHAGALPTQHLAARFCAKEAVAKALRLEAWSFKDVEVRSAEGGPPELRLYGSAATRAAELGVELSVSLTHSRSEAAAVVIAA